MHRPQILTKRTRWAALLVAGMCAITVAVPAGGAMATETPVEDLPVEAPPIEVPAPIEAPEPTEPPASAEDGGVSIQNHSEFQVLNLTGRTMIAGGARAYYSNQEARFDNDKPASAGEKIAPALEDVFALTHWPLVENASYLSYYFNGGWGSVTVEARVEAWIGTPTLKCVTTLGQARCDIEGRRAVIRSSDATSIVAEAAEPQKQADYLRLLCDAYSAHVSCTFKPKGELIKSRSKATMVGDTIHANCGSLGYSRETFTWRVDEGHTNSVALAVSARVGELVQVGVEVTYSHTWTWNVGFDESHAKEVAPGYYAWFTQQIAKATVTGDFTAKIGNDTVIMRDVEFTTPTAETYNVVAAHDAIMTPAQRVEFCGE